MSIEPELLPAYRRDIEKVDRIGDVEIDSAGIPFATDLMTQVPLAEAINDLDHPCDELLARISPNHIRSFVPKVLVDNYPALIWQDQYGNSYSTYSYKGNNLTNPNIFETSTSPSGFIFWGLQDGHAIERNVRASNILRELGVETEWIFSVGRLDKLPLEGQLVTAETYKAEIITKALGQTAVDVETEDNEKFDISKLAEAAKALKNTDLYVTARAHLVPYRMSDLNHIETKEDLVEMVNKTLHIMELANVPNKFNKSLSLTDEEKAEAYIYGYVPMKLAANLATLHANKLIHGFPHAGNISLSGGLLDLDSVRGKAVNPKDELRIEDYAKDAVYGLATLLEEIRISTEVWNLTDEERVDTEHFLQECYMGAYLDQLKNKGAYNKEHVKAIAKRLMQRTSGHTLNTAKHIVSNYAQFDHFPTNEESLELQQHLLDIGKNVLANINIKEIFTPKQNGAIVGLCDVYSEDLTLYLDVPNNPFPRVDKTDPSVVVNSTNAIFTLNTLIEMFDLQPALDQVKAQIIKKLVPHAQAPDLDTLNHMVQTYLVSGNDEGGPFPWVYSVMKTAFKKMDPIVPHHPLAEAVIANRADPLNIRHFTGIREMNAIGGHNDVDFELLIEKAEELGLEIHKEFREEPIYTWADNALNTLHPKRIIHVFSDTSLIARLNFIDTELLTGIEEFPSYLAVITEDDPNTLHIFSATDPEQAHVNYLKRAPEILDQAEKTA
jgi:hypothetical protein